MWLKFGNTMQKCILLVFMLRVYNGCEAITNSDFNAKIRDYLVAEDNLNVTDVKTLHKHSLGLGRYANFAPLQNAIKFKDVPDTVISGSDNARGLIAHTGYGFDYDDPHYGHGYDGHHDPHEYHHYNFHDSGHHYPPSHHHGYGHHHKHYDHGLAHKALLWPIAGIALLGAAAALVTNPVLLQLGVVSGKRRKRQVEEIENIAKSSIRKWSQITTDNKKYQNDDSILEKVLKKRTLRKNKIEIPKKYSEEDIRFIPIPLTIKNP